MRAKASIWILCGFAVMALVSVMSRVPRTPQIPSATLPPTPKMAAPDELPLTWKRDGKAIRVSWNSNLQTIRDAGSAELYITDGKHLSKLNLTHAHLQSGGAIYWPESDRDEVRFRLEVALPDRRLTRAVLASAIPLPELAAAPPPEPVEVEATVVAPPRRSSIRHYADRSVRKPVETSRMEPPVSHPPPPVESPRPVSTGYAERADAPARTAAPPASRPAPPADVTAEPRRPSRVGRVVGKIPLLRRLRHKPEQER